MYCTYTTCNHCNILLDGLEIFTDRWGRFVFCDKCGWAVTIRNYNV